MAESSPKEKKTLWEKEKLLIMSDFSLSHSVFKRLVQQTRKNQGLVGKGLTIVCVTKPLSNTCMSKFLTLKPHKEKAFEKHWKKLKMQATSNFSLSQNVLHSIK